MDPDSSPPIVIRLQALHLEPIGRLTEEYKPLLLIRTDILEIHWEVKGKAMMAPVPRSALSYQSEYMVEPFRLRMNVKPSNQLAGYFVRGTLGGPICKDLTLIDATAKPTGAKTAPWSQWVELLEKFDKISRNWLKKSMGRRAYPSDRLRELTKEQLRKSSDTFTSSARSSSTVRALSSTSTSDEDQTVTECPKSCSSDIADLDPTPFQDAEALLLAWQKINDRILIKVSSYTQQEKTLKHQEAMLESQQESLTVREAELELKEEFLKDDMKILKIEQGKLAAEKEEVKRQHEVMLMREACLTQEEKIFDNAAKELQKLKKRRVA